MASQALGFGELLAGGILLTMGISGQSIRDVLAGKGGVLKPLSSPAAAGFGPTGMPPGLQGPVGGKGVVNPLPGWSRSRIDQGVDFYGGRKIVAPEDATVLKVGAPGWPEGGGVLLKLVSGKIIFIYEGLTELVKPGQRVIAGQQIASGVPGGSIEIGYADKEGVPLAHSEYYEGKVTKFGRMMARWLNLIGAPR